MSPEYSIELDSKKFKITHLATILKALLFVCLLLQHVLQISVNNLTIHRYTTSISLIPYLA